ncbi:TlpA family protein disulfide reductase [Novosphingobium album (ex Liu et al. 2023)]|uniref:TlpA disulfide reductase family protein n=1 Tax=Novosphingobium album (ex Liu et al. 2023) TaxID=3031130 RepID=A0ABT5WJX3_9SPHN|nr:TlpA disulfide reductase family protein [Novosphingobium album (ex Liu et al. 2023)]MDE8650350.1 TlpA disulfide reductase family protein [Novosphingobium album (ex Liu et al. 2023)]
MPISRSLKLAVLGLALVAGGCDRQSGGEAQPQPSDSAAAAKADSLTKLDRSHKGEPIPDVTLKDAEGVEWKLATLTGKPLLVNLWATWCAPCVTELPTLNAIANRADLNLRVVTVSQDMDAPDKVRAFLDQRGFAQLPSVLDPNSDLAARYKAVTLPTTVLYDAQGKEVWRYSGGNEWTSEAALKLLAQAR